MSNRKPLIGIIILLFGLLTYFITFDDAHKERQRIIINNLRLTANIAKDIDEFINNCFYLMDVLSGIDDIDYISKVLERNSHINSFIILDSQGSKVHEFYKDLDSEEQKVFFNNYILPYLQYPLMGERYISNAIHFGIPFSKENHEIDKSEISQELITLGLPIISEDEISGIAFLTINISAFYPILDDYQIGENSNVLVRDEYGNIIYHPFYEECKTQNLKFLDIPLIPRSDNKIQRTSFDNKTKYITYQPMENAPWMVFVMQPFIEYQSPVFLIWIKNGTLLTLLSVFMYLLYALEKKDKRLLETQLTNERLEVAAQVAAGIAHEIKNPLVPIKGFIQLEKLKADSTLGQEIIRLLLNEISRIEKIINDFMTLAKSDPEKYHPVNILDVLKDVITLMEVETNKKGIRLIYNLPNIEKPILIDGSENNLTQVFQNVIKNSLEATEKGGLIEIEVRGDEKEVRITIKDNGQGIAPEHLLKIGTPFYSTKELGTGMGVAICQRIVKNHRGRIDITSQEGKGTIVDIILPTL